jgi:hypothetical protein
VRVLVETGNNGPLAYPPATVWMAVGASTAEIAVTAVLSVSRFGGPDRAQAPEVVGIGQIAPPSFRRRELGAVPFHPITATRFTALIFVGAGITGRSVR